MSTKILSIISALLIAVLMFTCTAPAVIGESIYEAYPDQTDGSDDIFFTEDGVATTLTGIAAITTGTFVTGGVIFAGISALTTVTVVGVIGAIGTGISIGFLAGAAIFGIGYGIWSLCH